MVVSIIIQFGGTPICGNPQIKLNMSTSNQQFPMIPIQITISGWCNFCAGEWMLALGLPDQWPLIISVRELDQGKNERNTIPLVKKMFRWPIFAGG